MSKAFKHIIERRKKFDEFIEANEIDLDKNEDIFSAWVWCWEVINMREKEIAELKELLENIKAEVETIPNCYDYAPRLRELLKEGGE